MTAKQFIVKAGDGNMVFFPGTVGNGVGYDIARASPLSYPRWNIEVHHENRRFQIPVTDKDIVFELLRLPRMRHG